MGIWILAYCAVFGAGVLLAIRESKASTGNLLPRWRRSSKAPYGRLLNSVWIFAAWVAAFELAGGSILWVFVLFLVAVSPDVVMPEVHNRRG